MKRITGAVSSLAAVTFLAGMALAAITPRGMAAAAPPPSLGVSPSRLEIAVEAQTTMGSATVLNLSDRDIHVKSSVVGFDLDEANNFRELAPEPGTLPTAMMVNPVEFTIPANGSQTVRFAISRARLAGPGEHRAMLFFSELVDTDQAGVKLNFRLGMPVYATVGEPRSLAVVNALRYDADGNRLELDLSATGNTQVKPSGFYLWWPVAEFPQESRAFKEVAALAASPTKTLPRHTAGGRLVTKPVFAGTRRSVAASLGPPPDAGEYMLIVHIEAGGQTVQRAIEYVPSRMLVVDNK